MTLTERNENMDKFFKDCMEILEKKGKDYNPSNVAFKDIYDLSNDLNIAPLQVVMVYASKHWQSIKSYTKYNNLESEPIRGRLLDLANYCSMLAVLIDEIEENKRRA